MNGFERHGITRLSPSTLNHFAAAPAHWVMTRLLRSALPAAVRGGRARTVSELRAAVGALGKSIADDQGKAKALTELPDLLISCGADDGVPVSEAVPQANGRRTMKLATGPSGECNSRKANTPTAMLQGGVGARPHPIGDGKR